MNTKGLGGGGAFEIGLMSIVSLGQSRHLILPFTSSLPLIRGSSIRDTSSCWGKVTPRVRNGGEGNGRLGLSIPFEVAPGGGAHSKLWR